MKRSDKATAHILVKAFTNSEWDNCEFAIIQLAEYWEKEQAKRLKTIIPFADDYNLLALHYCDSSVCFYITDDEGLPDIEEMLAGNEWVFVELENEERATFATPESDLDCYTLIVRTDGTALYRAYGRHTGEEFWTEDFLLKKIIEDLSKESQ